VNQLVTATAPTLRAWLDKIGIMLDAAESLEEFQEMLLAAYPDLDASGLETQLADAFTALSLRGRNDIETGA
jgi:phage gp29-like protein